MKLGEGQLEWPPGPALKYLLNFYSSGLAGDFLIGKFSSGDRFKVSKKQFFIN